jgi:16S rRNA (guanine527-N7)-methyltransferase
LRDDRRESLDRIFKNVSRETFSILDHFVERFQRWNRVTNLVAHSTVDDVWTRHVLDSAQLVALAPDKLIWVDLGSGGGFPGLITAILLRGTSGAKVHLVESNRKKTAFLHTIIGEYGLSAKVHAKRIDDCYEEVGAVEAVSSRALAALPHLLKFSAPWLQNGAVGYFHKGRDYQREVKESALTWRFDLLEHPSAIESQSVVLEIRNLARV